MCVERSERIRDHIQRSQIELEGDSLQGFSLQFRKEKKGSHWRKTCQTFDRFRAKRKREKGGGPEFFLSPGGRNYTKKAQRFPHRRKSRLSATKNGEGGRSDERKRGGDRACSSGKGLRTHQSSTCVSRQDFNKNKETEGRLLMICGGISGR